MKPGLYLLRAAHGRRVPVVVEQDGSGVIAGEPVSADEISALAVTGRLRRASQQEWSAAVDALGAAEHVLEAPPAVEPETVESLPPIAVTPPPMPARTVDLTRAAELIAAARSVTEDTDLTAATEVAYQARGEARRLATDVDAALAALREAIAEAESRASTVETALLDAARTVEAQIREQLLTLGLRRITTPGGVTAALCSAAPEVVITDRAAALRALIDDISDDALLRAARAAIRAGRTVPGVETRQRTGIRIVGPRADS